MMLWQYLAILIIHWIADFVLQTHWQAANKSKNIDALGEHVKTYTAVLALTVPIIMVQTITLSQWACFIVLNGLLHFLTDYHTSRASAPLFEQKKWHDFFVVIGLDQLIHQLTLGLTFMVCFS